MLIAAIVALCLLRFVPGTPVSPPAKLEVIAHRGVHHTYRSGAGRHGCTATLIHPPTHSFIENTIPSIEAAFEAGATMVEIDFHETSDGDVVVFHDWTIDCRTEGRGVTSEQTLAYLKSLDVGYGYTADGGKTFPLRGTGVGMMPTLREVLERFPDRRFILNQKSGKRVTLEALARVLRDTPPEQLQNLHYWGVMPDVARELVPGMGRPFHDRRALKKCGTEYMLSLGLREMPASCRGADIFVPGRATPVLWGWPHRFMRKARASGSRVILWTDDLALVERIGADGIMTDRIEDLRPK